MGAQVEAGPSQMGLNSLLPHWDTCRSTRWPLVPVRPTVPPVVMMAACACGPSPASSCWSSSRSGIRYWAHSLPWEPGLEQGPPNPKGPGLLGTFTSIAVTQQCLCVTWSPASCGRTEQQRVAAGYSDGTLRVFSISRTAMEFRVQPHSDALTAIAFSADGKGQHGEGQARGMGSTDHCLCMPGQSILSGDRSGHVAVTRLCTRVTLRVLSDHHGAPICSLQSTSKEVTSCYGVGGTALDSPCQLAPTSSSSPSMKTSG